MIKHRILFNLFSGLSGYNLENEKSMSLYLKHKIGFNRIQKCGNSSTLIFLDEILFKSKTKTIIKLIRKMQ